MSIYFFFFVDWSIEFLLKMRTTVCDPIILYTLCWVDILSWKKGFYSGNRKSNTNENQELKKWVEKKNWNKKYIRSGICIRDEKTNALKVNILIALPHSQLLTGFYFSTFFSELLLWFFEWILSMCTYQYQNVIRINPKFVFFFLKVAKPKFLSASSFAIWGDCMIQMFHFYS